MSEGGAMGATMRQIEEQAQTIANHAQWLAENATPAGCHSRALLILEQAKTLAAWTERVNWS